MYSAPDSYCKFVKILGPFIDCVRKKTVWADLCAVLECNLMFILTAFEIISHFTSLNCENVETILQRVFSSLKRRSLEMLPIWARMELFKLLLYSLAKIFCF